MKHITTVEEGGEGCLGRCITCGERNDRWSSYYEAAAWGDEHEQHPRKKQRGARPNLKTLEKFYRERAINTVYDPKERAQWLELADATLKQIKDEDTDGQMALFEETP